MEVRTEQMQFEQLPALASEVARVEMVREYAGEYRISGNHIPSMLEILNGYLSTANFSSLYWFRHKNSCYELVVHKAYVSHPMSVWLRFNYRLNHYIRHVGGNCCAWYWNWRMFNYEILIWCASVELELLLAVHPMILMGCQTGVACGSMPALVIEAAVWIG